MFIIQSNLISSDYLSGIQAAVEKYPHESVEVIPFSYEMVSKNPITGTDFIPYGSTLFTSIAYDLRWKGCYFNPDIFNYKTFLTNRDDMLNSNVMKIEDAVLFLEDQPDDSEWFTRPSLDLKQYTGMVDYAKDLVEWFNDAMSFTGTGSYKIEKGTDIVLCEPKNIQAEYRWFVVDGRVISGSMYRFNGNLYIQRCTEYDIITEAQGLADKWLPHVNCCMDLALVDGEFKVIEFNCINSSGWYSCDINSVIDAIWEYSNKI